MLGGSHDVSEGDREESRMTLVSGMSALMFLPVVRKTRKSRSKGKKMSSIWYMLKVRCSGWCGSVIECLPANQRVASLVPSLGYMPGLQARSPVGDA